MRRPALLVWSSEARAALQKKACPPVLLQFSENYRVSAPHGCQRLVDQGRWRRVDCLRAAENSGTALIGAVLLETQHKEHDMDLNSLGGLRW
jgi:hypothetical protein